MHPTFRRGTDGGFTRESIEHRLPKILDSLLEHTRGLKSSSVDAIKALQEEIRSHGAIEDTLDGTHWSAYAKPVKEAGLTWMTASWFFVENYFYQRIMKIVKDECSDPFQAQKDKGLEKCKEGVLETVIPLLESTDESPALLRKWIMRSLWGNKDDMSRSGGSITAKGSGGSDAHLLRDDSQPAVDLIMGLAGKTIGIMLDNGGLECVCDMGLIDAILTRTPVTHIKVFVKDAPVFVSDVMEKDFMDTLTWLEGVEQDQLTKLATRIRGYLEARRIVLIAHEFFSSPTFFVDMPGDIRSHCSDCALLISKGDANYRRLLSDAHWPFHTPPTEALGFMPCPVLCLRTCKSGVLIGVGSEVIVKAEADEPDTWLTSGDYGVVTLSTLM